MLPITYTYKNLSVRDKSFLNDYLPKKIDRFKTLLVRFSAKKCRLEAKAESFATKAAYKVDLSLHLPGNILRASEDNHTMIEAIDMAVDKLIIQLRKSVSKKLTLNHK